jgi:hypothetical protein
LHDSEKQPRPTDPPPEYTKPGIAWEEMLEVRKTLAVACAKVAGRSAVCTQFPTS